MKTFTYMVGEYKYEDIVAFGPAWRQAEAKAKELHVGIFRKVFNHTTKKTFHQFYAKGGAYLDMRFFHEDKLYIF